MRNFLKKGSQPKLFFLIIEGAWGCPTHIKNSSTFFVLGGISIYELVHENFFKIFVFCNLTMQKHQKSILIDPHLNFILFFFAKCVE